MQTTHKIPGSSATRWAKYLVSLNSRADYQNRDGNRLVPTQWHGSKDMLARFGLTPGDPVKLEDLRPLMHGYNPLTKEAIRPTGADGTRTAGVDLTYSPPKDVSALWALSDPYRRAQIEAAHRKAVASTLKQIEKEVSVVRRKTNGVGRFEKARSLLAAEAVHTSSRLSREQPQDGIPDPQLHSHVAVIAAERADGKMAAVESRQLMLAAREGGSWYRSELAANLRELGLDIQRRTGKDERYFGITGVPDALSDRWSTRDGDVDRAAQTFRRRHGREPEPGELDQLTLKTRGPKSTATQPDIENAYDAVGSEYHFTRQDATNLPTNSPTTPDPNIDLAKELLAEVNRERSMITTRELRAKAYELSAGVCRPSEADRLVNDLERSGELIRLEQGMWTTRTLRELEQTTIRVAEDRANENAVPVSEQALRQAQREAAKELHSPLSQEQRRALETITGQGGVTVLIGRAGTGKGVVTSAATRTWQLEGNQVIGTAIAGATAKRLQADTGTDRSMTTDSLLNGIEKGRIRLDPKSVVIMDEAGMADSDRLPRLINLTAQHQTKLLLVGDSAQLSSIGPGGLFKELEGKVPTAELTEVHRARHDWERQAWEEIRQGEPGRALARYQAHDRLHITDTRQEAMQTMVNHWNESRKTVPDGQAVMITDGSNNERDSLNGMAQERRAQVGELGARTVQLPGKPYGLAAGDQVIFTGQYRIPGAPRVENGITGTIIHASRDQDVVTIQTGEPEPRDIQVDTSKFSDLSLGYATHIRKGQGLTTETSQVLAGGWQTDKENIYVSVTRAREQTDIYITREDLGEQGLDTGAIQRLADRMQRSRAQEASITKEVSAQTPERKAEIAEHAADQSPDLSSRSNTSQPTGGEIDQVLQARQGRQLEWQNAIDVDRSGDVNEQAQEHHAIENLAESMRNEGASEDTITQEIAKLTAGREHDIQPHTQALNEHAQYIDQILEQQRQRLLDSEIPRDIDRERDSDRDPSAAQAEKTTRHPYIEEAIEQARERQQAFEQGIDQDRDNDLGYGIE
jgi:conjugative relaxase-like TrwC/TraI family protein